MIKNTYSFALCIVWLTTTVALSGCASLPEKGSISSKMPWSKKDKKPEPYPNPTRMAATWSPDTLVQTGRVPTRGFGGRLFFYDEKTRPVPVEGELTVHAFAENSDGSQGEVKRYHFTSEQFTEHFSQTDIGASYSVWIPWDAVGGDQTRVSLVPSFKAKGGRIVQGEQALVGLPGKRKSVEHIASRPTAASILAASRGDGQSGLVTTTIPVNSNLIREQSVAPAIKSQVTASSIAAGATPKTRSFDIANAMRTNAPPVNENALQSDAPENNANAVALIPNQLGERKQFQHAVGPAAPRPLRLGQNAPASVSQASANLPVE